MQHNDIAYNAKNSTVKFDEIFGGQTTSNGPWPLLASNLN
jgi:hypothetical protein